jgi:hypothetical protein
MMIKDVLRYDGKKIDPAISLPRRTLECLYEQGLEKRLELDRPNAMNEVLPICFLSLKYSYKHSKRVNDELKAAAGGAKPT